MKKYHYQKHMNAFFRAIVFIVIGTLCINPVSTGSGYLELSSKNDQNLAPQSGLYQTIFKEKFKAREVVLSHEAQNQYIREQSQKIIKQNGSIVKLAVELNDKEEAYLIPIPGLLKKTGQFAHLGLGRQYKAPVIYIDAGLAHEDREIVIRHEIDEITKWEELRAILGLSREGMRDWILAHINSPGEELNETRYAGLTARQIAKTFHEASYPLNALYEKYKNIDFEFDYIDKLCALSGYTEETLFYNPEASGDVNLAAGSATLDAAEPDTWIEKYARGLVGKTLVTLSLEGNIPELEGTLAQDANTKGGLGIYFGDKLEGLAGIGIKAIGIQPGYRYTKEGREVNYDELVAKGILTRVDVGPQPIIVWAGKEDPILGYKAKEYGENIPVEIKVYAVNRGGTISYILVSEIFDYLYNTPDLRDDPKKSRIHRFMQELVFGKAVHELLRRLQVAPDILHLNEAHVVLGAAHLKMDDYFRKTKVVYTNHTLTPVGLEVFRIEDMFDMDMGRLRYLIGWPEWGAKMFEDVFVIKGSYGKFKIDFCQAAFLIADKVTAVSEEHAKATESLFKSLYGDRFNKKVIPVLNGSGKTWKNQGLVEIEKQGRIPTPEELWALHEQAEQEASSVIQERSGRRLDLNKPTIWAVRRIVEYKSQYPILRFLVHVVCAERETTFTKASLWELWKETIPELGDMDDEDVTKPYNQNVQHLRKTAGEILNALFGDRDKIHGLGMQVVVGGPAWAYEDKKWVGTFKNWHKDDRIPGFIYVPYSDIKLLRMQAIGADNCINMPRPLEGTDALEEACGTSDQRHGMNGGINIAVVGAGPIEWMTDYDESTGEGSGFMVGPYIKETPEGPKADLDKFYRQAPVDIFRKLEIASRLFYEDGKPKWKRFMQNAYIASHYGNPKKGKKAVTAEAMEKRYARDVYLAALGEKPKDVEEGVIDMEPEVKIMLARLNAPDRTKEPKEYIIHEASVLAANGKTQEALELLFTTGALGNLEIPAEVLNRLIEAYVKDDTRLGMVKDFASNLISGAVEFSGEDKSSIELAQSLQLMASQALTILSWIDRGVKGAENMRLTADAARMAQNEKYKKSFIDNDKTTLPQGIEEVKKEGQAGYFWRGIEKIEKLGENIVNIFKYSIGRFEAMREKLVMYAMNHGFIEVPQALKEATSQGLISTMHETSFINDLLPGSNQTTSTGAGHFQGKKLDIKHVTGGKGIQVNVLYSAEGKIIKVLTQYIEEGDWCLALPGHVDYMINLGGLRFNDISIESEAAQVGGANAAIAPYMGVMLESGPALVKTIKDKDASVIEWKWIKRYNDWPDKFRHGDSLLGIYNEVSGMDDFYNIISRLSAAADESNLDSSCQDIRVMAASEIETAKASSLTVKAPSFGKVEGVCKFIDDNAGDLAKLAKGEANDVKLIRIPVQLIEAVGKDNIKDFIAALQDERSSAYIELFSMENIVADISEDQYRKYDIPRKQKPLPSGFTSDRTNTITILPVSKDDTFATGGRKIQDAWSWELGGISPDKTIISPVGFNYDRSGLVRSILLSIRLSEIAKEPGDTKLVSDTLAQYKALCVSQGQNPDDPNSSLTAQDLINMAKGDMSEMVESLNRLIKFLPIVPINIEEMRLIFERVREILIRA